MKISEILIESKERIEKERNWCQGTHNRGNKWCAIGSLAESIYIHYFHLDAPYEYNATIKYLLRAASDLLPKRILIADDIRTYSNDIIEINDRIGHEAVIKMYDNAIKLALQDEASDLIPAEEKDASEEVPSDEPDEEFDFDYDQKEEALALV